MSGKNLSERTEYGERCYQQGVADTHARYEAMQAQTREWLQACIELVGLYESGKPLGMTELQRRSVAMRLREALNLDPSVTIEHVDDESSEVTR